MAGRVVAVEPVESHPGRLATGITIGLFFGEGAAALQPIADIYIRLMQMTVCHTWSFR